VDRGQPLYPHRPPGGRRNAPVRRCGLMQTKSNGPAINGAATTSPSDYQYISLDRRIAARYPDLSVWDRARLVVEIVESRNLEDSELGRCPSKG
jgi:hypothetical protein